MPLDPLNDPLLRAPRSHASTIAGMTEAANTATPEQLADFVDAIGASGGGGGGGHPPTDLGATATPTGVTVTSSTGADALLPLATATNAGLMAPAQHAKLADLPTAAALATDQAAQDLAIGDKADASHTHTPAAIGAATTAQGAKADTALQPGVLPVGTTLPAAQISDATTPGRALLTAADAAAQRAALALGNVNNTSDANKPISTAQQTALDGKMAATLPALQAVFDTGTAPQKAAFQSSVSGDPMLAYVDFTTQPDGYPLSILDSGQAVDYTFGATGRRPVISSGRLVVENQASAGTGGLADYYQSDMGAPVTRVGCEWTQPAGADDGNGNITYAAWNSIYEGGGTNVARSWVHMSVVPGSGAIGTAKWSVCNGVGNLFVIKQQTFRNPAADGLAPWRSEAVLDLDSGIAYAWLPDGSVMTVNNAEIAAMCTTLAIPVVSFANLSASVLMCEHFTLTGANAAKFGGIKSMWGETAASTPKGHKARLTQLQEMRAAAAAKAATPGYPVTAIYAPTTQMSVATTTSAASVDATNGKVSQVAGPLGKIIFQVTAHYEWAATDVMFWRLAGTVNTATRAAAIGVAGQKGLVTQTIEATGLTPGQSYNYILQHWSVSAGSATCKAGGSGGSMLPPLTILAMPQ